jgi:hypothetical protein
VTDPKDQELKAVMKYLELAAKIKRMMDCDIIPTECGYSVMRKGCGILVVPETLHAFEVFVIGVECGLAVAQEKKAVKAT